MAPQVYHGPKGHTFDDDLAPDPGEVSHLGSLSRDHKDRRREFKTKRPVNGWAGWAPVFDAEKATFQELVLCPRSDHGEPAYAMLRRARGWPFYTIGWWALLQ